MYMVDEDVAHAPPEICFQVAADVERWPEILPHYRWVRFHEKIGFADGVVEMAAWRRFPLVRYPTWWVSEMTNDPDDLVVIYRHVDGITRGMDVRWEIREEGGGQTRFRVIHDWKGPAWPLVRGIAANGVIGPVFVSHIVVRTLAGVVREAERVARA